MTEAVVGELENRKSAPPPPKFTTCGLLAALSVMVSTPVLLPATVGVKVTLMAQLAAGAKPVPQVLSCAKSPVTVIPAIVKAAVPVLVIVIVCGALVDPSAWLVKVKLVDDRLTTGAAKPMPERVTVCGLFAALSVITTVP